jgi:hypothetical protein
MIHDDELPEEFCEKPDFQPCVAWLYRPTRREYKHPASCYVTFDLNSASIGVDANNDIIIKERFS